jgi:hypothetical protein
MAINGSGCSAIGMASFSSSEALRFAGAEGGGAGVGAETLLAVLDWPQATLSQTHRPITAGRMNNDLRRTAAVPPDQANGRGWVGSEISREPKLFMLVEPLELGN